MRRRRGARQIGGAVILAGVMSVAGSVVASADPGRVPAADAGSEIGCLALTIYHEARGEPDLGKQAVAHVVMNRSRDARFPKRLCDVAWQDRGPLREDCQFTWTCDGVSDVPRDARAWQESLDLATLVYDGKSQDPTGGALWFHADYVDPVWRLAMNPGQQIGRHIFYRGPGGTMGGTMTAALKSEPSVARGGGIDAATIALVTQALDGAASSLPSLSITVTYSRHAKKRTIRLNDWAFHEGDSPAPGIKVEAIMPRGVVLSYRNGQFRRLLPAS